MRYAIAKALVFSLMQDEYFSTRPESEKRHIAEKILEDVKGRMMEDIVLLETAGASARNSDVFKFKFDEGGEYDMVIYDPQTDTCSIFEVKHSERTDPKQTRYLRDETRLAVISHRYGKISGRYVIYRGAPCTVDGIEYVNVEEYLISLGEKRRKREIKTQSELER